MDVHVNGQTRSLDDPITVTGLLDQLDLAGNFVAVEVNRELIPRDRHASHHLSDGDRVEIVTLVGGG